MDKKKWTYVLIVIVSGLWIYNIYKTVQTLKTPDAVNSDFSDNYLSFSTGNSMKDTFLLVLPNKDPFLDVKFSRTNLNPTNDMGSVGLNKKINQSPPIKVLPQKTLWPKIQYYGFVKNRTKDHQLCVISVDNKLQKMAIGESFNNLKILDASIDSLKIQFLGEIKSIPK